MTHLDEYANKYRHVVFDRRDEPVVETLGRGFLSAPSGASSRKPVRARVLHLQ